jgi:CheY-like chemotaxis protein
MAPPPAAGPWVRGKRILVVDDEIEVAEVLAEFLAMDQHTVAVERNGAFALARPDLAQHDVIFTDVRMPVLDGAGLFRRATERHPVLATRFVFITGGTLRERETELLEQTEAPSLTKPFTLHDVRAVLRRVLGDP